MGKSLPKMGFLVVMDERRLPAVLLVRQRHLVAVLAHPDDDRAEAGPGVEPGVEDHELEDRRPPLDKTKPRAAMRRRGGGALFMDVYH